MDRSRNPRRPWVNALDVDVGIYVFFSFRVGVSPGELADFILGWVGIDIGADDGEVEGQQGEGAEAEEASRSRSSPG